MNLITVLPVRLWCNGFNV